MKEHPIPFTCPMVRAILAGEKTQTRRVVARTNSTISSRQWSAEDWADLDFLDATEDGAPYRKSVPGLDRGGYLRVDRKRGGERPHEVQCRIGTRDVLWVRETWRTDERFDFIKPSEIENGSIDFKASLPELLNQNVTAPLNGKWRSSRFMPRWACRLRLRVVSVRAERVQEITADDAIAEGVWHGCEDNPPATPQDCFAVLWDSINAKRGYPWESNPWVWRIEFERIEEDK